MISLYNPFSFSTTLFQNAVEGVKLLLVGNKVDIEDMRQVEKRRGEKVLYTSIHLSCVLHVCSYVYNS